jgi:hypothetical protein
MSNYLSLGRLLVLADCVLGVAVASVAPECARHCDSIKFVRPIHGKNAHAVPYRGE